MSKYRDKEKFEYNSHFISGETMCLQVSIELLLLSLSNSKNLNFQTTQSKRHANYNTLCVFSIKSILLKAPSFHM